MLALAARLTSALIVLVAHFITAVRAEWRGTLPDSKQRVYFANHSSHGDFVLVWTVLPEPLRRRTRPVAGADYWMTSALRRFIAQRVFNAVLIDRRAEQRQTDAVQQMVDVLEAGDSLILFPEGTRNTGDAPLLPFRSGLYHLANRCPAVDLVPVWINNLNRVLPKGHVVPVPLICTVRFGEVMRLEAGEDKQAFLQRASGALLALRPMRAENPADASAITS